MCSICVSVCCSVVLLYMYTTMLRWVDCVYVVLCEARETKIRYEFLTLPHIYEYIYIDIYYSSSSIFLLLLLCLLWILLTSFKHNSTAFANKQNTYYIYMYIPLIKSSAFIMCSCVFISSLLHSCCCCRFCCCCCWCLPAVLFTIMRRTRSNAEEKCLYGLFWAAKGIMAPFRH